MSRIPDIKSEPSRITNIILDDKRIIGYRPRLNEHTGGVISTIILCQAMYWAKTSGNPFYKFRKPCEHKSYKPGDSWCEELGLTGTEFDTGLKRIGKKINRNEAADPEAMIWYWNDMDRKTHYAVNWDKINQVIAAAYGLNGEEIQESSTTKLRNPELGNSGKLKDKVEEPSISIKETTNTQSLPTNTSSSVPPAKELRIELINLGLDEDEALRLLKIWPRHLIYQKILDIKEAYSGGKVGNLLAYVKKVFSQRKLYTPQESQEIYRKYQKLDTAKQKQEEDKKVENIQEAERGERIERNEKLIADVSPEELQQFEVYLKDEHKTMLLKLYHKSGIEGLFVRAALGNWLAERQK